ncbi:MAG TPA: hypothetical protein PLO56_14805 [Rhodothermales bacterium]|nr:hypothetical protein [Rhodothermales bacterium]
MNLLPVSVKTYLESISIERFRPAFVQADPVGNIVLVGGDWFNLGIPEPLPNTILEMVPLLVGLLPLNGESFLVPDVHMKNGRIADAHFFHELDGDWVVFVDVTLQHIEKQQLFQQANELQLIKQNLGKLRINGHGRMASTLQQELIYRYREGSQAQVVVLEVVFDLDVAVKDPETIQVAFAEIGVLLQQIEKLLGEALAWPIFVAASGFQAILGIIPTDKDLQEVVGELTEKLLALMLSIPTYFDAKSGLRPVIVLRGGISWGAVWIANVPIYGQNRLTILGEAIDKARELTSKAKPGQILSEFLVH